MDKPKINHEYYTIDLNDDWTHYCYITKTNVMDQMDRYNFATANWDDDLDRLVTRTYDILHNLTTLNDEDIASLMMQHERNAK